MSFEILSGDLGQDDFNRSGHEVRENFFIVKTGGLGSRKIGIRTSTITVLNEENHARILPAAAGGIAFGASGAVVGAILAGNKNYKIALIESGDSKFVGKFDNKTFTKVVAAQHSNPKRDSEDGWLQIAVALFCGIAFVIAPFTVGGQSGDDYPAYSLLIVALMGIGCFYYAWWAFNKKRKNSPNG